MNESYFRVKNDTNEFFSFTAGTEIPSSLWSGSKWCLRLLQKCTYTVFDLENPSVSAQVCSLFRQVCSCLSFEFIRDDL
jgi:hypothetical protein